MKLPYADQAYVPEAKIVKYLLNVEHTGGGKAKAQFFMRFGFTLDQWTVLAEALLAHAVQYEIASTRETAEGMHYVIEGTLQTPDGRNPAVRVVWALDNDTMTPRLITAHPLK
jgi:hypothetical protein